MVCMHARETKNKRHMKSQGQGDVMICYAMHAWKICKGHKVTQGIIDTSDIIITLTGWTHMQQVPNREGSTLGALQGKRK